MIKGNDLSVENFVKENNSIIQLLGERATARLSTLVPDEYAQTALDMDFENPAHLDAALDIISLNDPACSSSVELAREMNGYQGEAVHSSLVAPGHQAQEAISAAENGADYSYDAGRGR